MRRFTEFTVAGVCAASLAASMAVVLGAHAQSAIQQVKPQQVADALKAAGFKPMTGEMEGQMLKVPVNRHNIIGAKPPEIKNPYAGDKQAWAQGKKLYESLNCAVCHGQQGGGGQGVPLSLGHWKYGEEAANVYLDISHGRPKGMPAWGNALPPQLIWYLVTYVKTLPLPESQKPGPPPKTPISLQNKSRQAPITRNFGYPPSSGAR